MKKKKEDRNEANEQRKECSNERRNEEKFFHGKELNLTACLAKIRKKVSQMKTKD